MGFQLPHYPMSVAGVAIHPAQPQQLLSWWHLLSNGYNT